MKAHDPLVYFIGSKEYVKIGTTTNLSMRFREIAKHLPFEVDLLGVMAGGQEEERRIQSRFILQGTRMEWFVLNRPLLDFIKENCRMVPIERARDYEHSFDSSRDEEAKRFSFYKILACREGRRLEIDAHVKDMAKIMENA